ncbi:uncharacterized protein TA20285 [Theileria annulata]|uniref:Uncharacterized protein n=1 Tax=Theileria annulata TaxID=5874 RepID=Q4UHA0_THEAN|nr:uncharacterized protein TA20285 [Theileria annulata]CAI73539.1 hypothetical protein TA20285 [Theileria annulata]|eukprot:XP_954216.1 hypothetical protein TA20285 [Theileria annulata]
MSNVVELLIILLDEIKPLKNIKLDDWNLIINSVKNNLNNSKNFIYSSPDPLIEAFSTLLNSYLSNKYGLPGSNLYNALTLGRILRENVNINQNIEEQNINDDDKKKNIFVNTIKRLFNKDVENEINERRYYRDPYKLRSGSSKGGSQLISSNTTTDTNTINENNEDTNITNENNEVENLDITNENNTILIEDTSSVTVLGQADSNTNNLTTTVETTTEDTSTIGASTVTEEKNNNEIAVVTKTRESDTNSKDTNNKDTNNKDTNNKDSTSKDIKGSEVISSQTSTAGASTVTGTVTGNIYIPLNNIINEMKNINLYVVALEMIRASVRNVNNQRDVFNYRAIDPSVFNTNGIDYSIQIITSNVKQQHHINFGDILRLKRVDAFTVIDKFGKKHINIIMSIKNFPTMRLWHSNLYNFSNTVLGHTATTSTTNTTTSTTGPSTVTEGKRANSMGMECNRERELINTFSTPGKRANSMVTECTMGKGATVTKDTKGNMNTSTEDSEDIGGGGPDTVTEVINIYGGIKINITNEDNRIIEFLKNWSKKLNPNQLLTSEYLKKLSEASENPYDFIVKILSVWINENTILVTDNINKAIVCNFDPILISNLFNSFNPLQRGDWIKLRSFVRIFNDNKIITLTTTKYSCVTRLPLQFFHNQQDKFVTVSVTVTGPPDTSSLVIYIILTNLINLIIKLISNLIRERRVNLDVWSKTSCLNNSFPKRFKRSPTFIQKLLSTQPIVLRERELIVVRIVQVLRELQVLGSKPSAVILIVLLLQKVLLNKILLSIVLTRERELTTGMECTSTNSVRELIYTFGTPGKGANSMVTECTSEKKSPPKGANTNTNTTTVLLYSILTTITTVYY